MQQKYLLISEETTTTINRFGNFTHSPRPPLLRSPKSERFESVSAISVALWGTLECMRRPASLAKSKMCLVPECAMHRNSLKWLVISGG